VKLIQFKRDEKQNSDGPAEIPNSPEQIATPTSLACARTEFYPSSKFNWEIPKELQEKPGPRKILVVQFSRRAVEKSKVSRLQAATFQEGRDRMHIVGERQVQITKSLEEKSKRGSVYNRRFLYGDCRFQPSLISPEADPNGPTCRFLENWAPLVISWRSIEQMTKFSRKGGADYKWK
jgi:hypothetical protein